MRLIPMTVLRHEEDMPYCTMHIEGRETTTEHTLHFFELVRLRRELHHAILGMAQAFPKMAKETDLTLEE